jgi:TonB family protein
LSQKLGEEGITMLLVHIQANGSVDNCAVKSSSGSVLLDRAACAHVQATWRWKTPVVQGKPQAVSTQVNVLWNLKQREQEQ